MKKNNNLQPSFYYNHNSIVEESWWSSMLRKFRHLADYITNVKEWQLILLLRLGLIKRVSVHFRKNALHNGNCGVDVTRDKYSSFSALVYILSEGGIYDPCSDTLGLEIQGRKLYFTNVFKIKDRSFTDHIYTVFYMEEYGFLNVKDRKVADIGASIGESSIYFSLKGADRVVSYEPNPSVCELLKRNISLNGLENLIEVRCAAISPSISKHYLCINESWSGSSFLTDNPKNCGNLRHVTVETEPPPKNVDVVKLDCEGCEFDFVNSLTEPLYHEIGMEYHPQYGSVKEMIRKLVKLGYKVKHVKQYKNSNLGLLHAVSPI